MNKVLLSLLVSVVVALGSDVVVNDVVSDSNENNFVIPNSSMVISMNVFNNSKKININKNGDKCMFPADCDYGEICVKDKYGIDGICVGGY